MPLQPASSNIVAAQSSPATAGNNDFLALNIGNANSPAPRVVHAEPNNMRGAVTNLACSAATFNLVGSSLFSFGITHSNDKLFFAGAGLFGVGAALSVSTIAVFFASMHAGGSR